MEIKKTDDKTDFLRNNRITIAGAMVGAIVAYLYYYFVGCANGTCVITSNPWISTSYGAMMGGLLFSMFKKE